MSSRCLRSAKIALTLIGATAAEGLTDDWPSGWVDGLAGVRFADGTGEQSLLLCLSNADSDTGGARQVPCCVAAEDIGGAGNTSGRKGISSGGEDGGGADITSGGNGTLGGGKEGGREGITGGGESISSSGEEGGGEGGIGSAAGNSGDGKGTIAEIITDSCLSRGCCSACWASALPASMQQVAGHDLHSCNKSAAEKSSRSDLSLIHDGNGIEEHMKAEVLEHNSIGVQDRGQSSCAI